MKPEAIAFALFALLLAACATGAVDAEEAPAALAVAGSETLAPRTGPMATTGLGYLNLSTLPDVARIIPPAPEPGDVRNDADWAIFRATRSLEKTDRWALAQSDDGYRPRNLMASFACALDIELTPDAAPVLATMMSRVTVDSGAAVEGPKQAYRRNRPYLHNEGPICIARTQALDASFDYPSGHAALGFANALVLAELVPERSAYIVARGRAFGESRVVCGLHNYSSVEASRTGAAAVVAALHGNEAFRTDLATARSEIAAARASGARPDAAGCAREFELTQPLLAL